MKKGLVSIITPCFNGGMLIHRLLDSILKQDYSMIEMYVVDDGSIDNTRSVIESYIDRFTNKGYVLNYIYQDNAGQAAAINKALPLVDGAYLVWPDADDFFSRDYAISEMVQTFSKLEDSYGVIRYKAKIVEEKTLKVITEQKYRVNKEHIFEEYFTGKESIAVAGTHIVRMKAFDDVISNRKIFDKRYPQNFQLLLPLSYSYKIFTLEKTLFTIVVRLNSHSHRADNYEKHFEDFEGYQEILNNTISAIKVMPVQEREKYLRLGSIYCYTGKLYYALKFGKAKDAKAFAKELKKIGVEQTTAGKIRLILVYSLPLLNLFDRIVNKLRTR